MVNSDAPLYEKDPEAWKEHLAEGNARQPRKRVSADVIIRDSRQRILLVDPKYKPDWDTPGGMVEANEPPDRAVQRELKEELGLEIRVGRLLVVDWVSPHDPWDDLLAFVFEGGQLSDEEVRNIAPQDDELSTTEFCTPSQAQERLRPYVWHRVAAALDAVERHTVHYLRDGVSP
ncbi:NUDIX hydrolase [Actinoplanes sp. NPDC051633]|uniref:NUDIX hydrolase n=1 Tax=Actinoplanes sp. NPDC051633 TaxID=3155670 RepID=UPI0034341403